MIQKTVVAALAVTAAFAAAPAAAQSNWYAVASIGRSDVEADPAAVNAYALSTGFATATTTSSGDDRGWKVQLGYRFAPMWSIEGGYTSLGESTFTTTTNAGAIVGKKEVDLWNIDLVGTFAINPQWAILGRVGGIRWETKSDLPNATTTLVTIKDNGYSFKYGAGVAYSFTPNFEVRAEYERFHNIGEQARTGESSINMYSIGAVLKF
jgi:OOP family OmpA-OmpF porin